MSILDKLSTGAGSSELLTQIADGFFGSDIQRDYAHASKLMTPNGMALAPKQKFLFHVFFTLNADYKNKPSDRGLYGALVKSVSLPSFSLDTEEYIQYNRKRLVHNRVKYEPVQIKLHDDGSNVIGNLWQAYYNYYFADSSYQYDTGQVDGTTLPKTDYTGRDLYNPARVNQDKGWGKTVLGSDDTGRKLAFFKDIKIFGLNRGNFTSYTLINPVITNWKGDTYDYSEGAGVMEYDMTVQYEAVKYGGGEVNTETVKGFGLDAPSRYDTAPGALGAGSTKSLLGQGGITDTAFGAYDDLASGNIAGAIQKVGASARTFGSIENVGSTVASGISDEVDSAVLADAGKSTRSERFPSIKTNSAVTTTTATPTRAADFGGNDDS